MAFEKVWLDTGQKIKDGQGCEHPMTVCAHSAVELKNYLGQGWTPVTEEIDINGSQGDHADNSVNTKRGKR